MEGRGDLKTEPSRSNKRPLGSRTSSGVDVHPRKLKPSTKTAPALTPSDVKSYFQMESRVHDVEEHFRRSLQQIHTDQQQPSLSQHNSRKHVVRENSPQLIRATPSPVQSPPTLSPILMRQQNSESSKRDQTVASSSNSIDPHSAPPPLILGISGSTKQDSLKTYNEVLSLSAAQQLLSAASLGQSGGRGLLFPNILPASQSNFIPVIDSNGVTQLMASSAAHPSLSTQNIPPIVFLGPGNIPFLPATQHGMYLVNPSTDLSSLQQPSPTLPSSLSGMSTQPSYIVLPQSYQPFHMPQGLTLEQLQALSTSFQQQQQQQQQQQIDTRQRETPPRLINLSDSVSSRPSIDSNHSNDGDEVEEHFARALGDKYKKFLKDSSSPPNKIST